MSVPETSKPRVLQLALSLNPGGTERLIVDMVRRLRDTGEMAVCCLDEAGTWGTQLQREGIEVTVLHRRPGFHFGLGRQIASAARRHRSTVIHAHQYTPFVYACLSRLSLAAVPLIFTEHGRLSDAPPSAKRRMANRVLRQVPARVFAVSADLKRFMVEEGFSESQVEVLYNGIELRPLPSPADRHDVRSSMGIDDATWLVGTVARLDPVKNLETLLRAVATSRQRRTIAAVIVGDGPERSRLTSLAADLCIQSSVHFLGHRDDARRWLAGCDAYVNSSTSEGVSLTILEAMAAALPVVVTRVGGTPEVVTSECGVLVPARDPSMLAAALDAMAAAPDEARRMGVAGRARVEARFTMERMVQDYADAYREVSK